VLVALAICFTRFAPTFFVLSLNSILFATVAPSFVTLGSPWLFSIITLRPYKEKVGTKAEAH